MLARLKQLEATGRRIRVGIVGCGAMGNGVAWQTARTPGMEVVFLGDISDAALEVGRAASRARGIPWDGTGAPPARAAGEVYLTKNSQALLDHPEFELDVLVECTNTIAIAGRYCLAAIAKKAHVILMNAEVDLALGSLLAHEARKQGVIVSSDAGDQHGVLATMIEEIELWGFRIVQAGNIKGYLRRHALAPEMESIANDLKLSTVQCVAYTDGTKLNVEMAIIGNGANLTPIQPGMQGHEFGSEKKDVKSVMDLFDFDAYGQQGRIDYVINAEPGGGVYVVGFQSDPGQHFLLGYYKVNAVASKQADGGWYYLFYRPYHLCTLETTRAIGQAFFDKKAVLAPPARLINDVYAYAKLDLPAGTSIEHGIGGDEVYGLVESCAEADARGGGVPVCWLESAGHGPHAQRAVITRAYLKDDPIRLEDVTFPDTDLHALLRLQDAARQS